MYFLASLSSCHIIDKDKNATSSQEWTISDWTLEIFLIPHQVGCHYGFTLRSWLDAVQVHQFKIEFHALMYNWWLPQHWSHHYNSSRGKHDTT